MTVVQAKPVSAQSTLDLLQARIRQRGDFPGFAKAIHAILAAMRGEDDREFNMTKTVLSDPALTQRVLRLANSPMYAAFSDGIGTVSRAVVVLGTDAIGHLALGLKLVDELSSVSAGAANARSEMNKALLSGHIARQVAGTAGTRDAEEAVVCSMLHSLGRMMVSFYLSEQWEAIDARCSREQADEAAIAQQVLGIGLDEIGQAIARRWGLPGMLVDSLRHVAPQPVAEPLDHGQWLAAISTVASRCARVLYDDGADPAAEIDRIAASYADMLGMESAALLSAVDSAKEVAQQDAILAPKPAAASQMRDGGRPADAERILASGIADMHNAMNTVNMPQLVTMALETVYKGLGLSRAVAFVRDQHQARYVARMCFGDGMQELLPRLAFGDGYRPDVFHAALASDKIIFIENPHDPQFVNKLPRWWKDAFAKAQGFLVLPLSVNRQPVGFIYGDWERDAPHRLEPGDAALLDELRAVVVQAVTNRRRTDTMLTRKIP